jgi:hypothetical protein
MKTPELPGGSNDAGAAPQQDMDAAARPSSEADASLGASAGSPAVAAVGGSGGASGGGGSPGAPAALSGSLTGAAFTVQAGFVSGLSDEFQTTTLYLFDSAISCSQLSTLAWLSQLPSTARVIEITFPTTASTGSPVTGSTVSYARGGTYAFSTMRASTSKLILSRVTQGGAVDGTLMASFGAGSVDGAFHADFCATGTAL